MDADGRVVIGGPTLAAGYLDDPVATGTAFVEHDDGRAFGPATSAAGWTAGSRCSAASTT
jgi:hypothetical protein